MEIHDTAENWDVEVDGSVFTGCFAEITGWIAEGALQPNDKVRKGDHSWIEAKRVPALVPFFNAKLNGTPQPMLVSVVDGENDTAPQQINSRSFINRSAQMTAPEAPFTSVTGVIPDRCSFHPTVSSVYLCLSCGIGMCRQCPKTFSSTVIICASCGNLCKAKHDIEAEAIKESERLAAQREGFGFVDLQRALSHPFNFKTSLFLGALMFAFVSLGESAFAFGSIYLMVGAIFSFMLANMLSFGILSNTVNQFSHGGLHSNFMPRFDDFSLWDDVVHPFFLCIGAYIPSFGAFIVVAMVGMYLMASAASSQLEIVKNELEKTPGTPYYSARDTVDQSKQVRDALTNAQRQNNARLQQQEDIEKGATTFAEDKEEANFQEMNRTIADNQRKSLESALGKSPETRDAESRRMVSGFLQLSAPLVVLGFLALLWGIFYFPAACAVAGYTRSFVATVNPLVGLDTIKRLGFNYVKLLLMGLLLLAASGLVAAIFGTLLSPFDLPAVGNLPAKFLSSIFNFYLWIVFSCILGYVMFKSSDKLHLLS